MSVVGIIAEYNPFHLGHKYQIEKIREAFGADTVIVAVMSGNFTQRGDMAIFDKATRAKAAVLSGIDLVLELPFPFSMSSAEVFAKSGIKILDSLGVVDYLSFGSECGSVEKLMRAADILKNEDISAKETHDSKGYAARAEELFSKSGGEADFFTSNNILGIEYIKALKSIDSKIIPTTIKRSGADYNDNEICGTQFQSAMAIRTLISKKDKTALDFVPKEAADIYRAAIDGGEAPTDSSRLDSAVISSLRLNLPMQGSEEIHDCGGGLYNRIRSESFLSNSIISLTERVKTKKYTTARIRRAIWFSYFGVTSSDIRTMPSYTQVLAMSTAGAALLKRIKKVSDFPILTKPSRTDGLNDCATKAKHLLDGADSVFQLSKPLGVRGDYGLLFTPFVKKEDFPR